MEIINIGNTFYTNYVLRFEKNVILIDCGYNCSYEKFLKKINKLGIAVEDIKVVLITHVHQDHVSYLEELLNHINPTIIVGKEAIELLKKGEDQFYSLRLREIWHDHPFSPTRAGRLTRLRCRDFCWKKHECNA